MSKTSQKTDKLSEPIPELLKELKQNYLKNINMVNFLRNYGINRLERTGNSIMIRGESDKSWIYFSSDNESELNTLCTMLVPEDIYFAALEDWMIDVICKYRKPVWKLSCLRLFLPRDHQVREPKHLLKPLTVRDVAYIYENSSYKKYTDYDYILDRVKNGISLGLYDRGGLIAWILTHDDGAMGFLNVLPEYRRMGYGSDLTRGMIKILRSKNRIPFVHIEEENTKSMNLAVKLGFEKDRTVLWMRAEAQ